MGTFHKKRWGENGTWRISFIFSVLLHGLWRAGIRAGLLLFIGNNYGKKVPYPPYNIGFAASVRTRAERVALQDADHRRGGILRLPREAKRRAVPHQRQLRRVAGGNHAPQPRSEGRAEGGANPLHSQENGATDRHAAATHATIDRHAAYPATRGLDNGLAGRRHRMPLRVARPGKQPGDHNGRRNARRGGQRNHHARHIHRHRRLH